MPLFSSHPTIVESTSQCAAPASKTSLPDSEAALPVIPFPERESIGSEDHGLAKPLAEAFRAINNSDMVSREHGNSKPSKPLSATGAAIDAIQTNVATAQSYASTTKPVFESDAMKAIRAGVNTLVDSLPGLVAALDEVAKLHPFIGIAVSAFRIVVELDMKRRDNDKKISVLFVEMRDMMNALLQLSGIKDVESVGPDGKTIEARMQELIKKTAEDIKSCANACDAYVKKKLLVKVIKGPIWEGTLKGFINLFINRRKEFTFALSIHVGMGVDDANRKLKEIDVKIDMVLDFFSKVVSPEQQELAALVQKMGGPATVMGDNDALRELMKFRPASAIGQMKRGSGGRDGTEYNSPQGGDDLALVKQELFDSPELAIKKNLEVFERKFKMQQRELAEEMRRVVHHEGDRVIQAITSGPHDRIVDPDIHEIWKEMQWPGHVKARHFVLALRDYYTQQIERKRGGADDTSVVTTQVADQDKWALEWISINRLQAIAEAFDDDASGFITITEVNHFTASRPKEWSLPHWLAYWAIGWQITATKYRHMIVGICAKMFAIRSHILPANQGTVYQYLQSIWQRICTLTSSLNETYEDESLEERFKGYVDTEEQRLREALETVHYKIDAMDALLLVTGPGRVEKHLFPLLWLLLHRDFEIFRLSRDTIVHKDEFRASMYTIMEVLDAVNRRYEDLCALFKQQKVDPGSQFKTFASEVFNLWHDSKQFWSLDNLQTLEFPEVEYEDSEEDKNVDVNKLLHYPSAADNLYPPQIEDCITDNDAAADEAVRLILGRWNGYDVGPDKLGIMMTFSIRASMDHRTYEASAIDCDDDHFNILGNYTTGDGGMVEYRFKRTFIMFSYSEDWTGTLSDDGETLSGKWGYEKDDQPYTFLLKRVPPEVLVDRPHPKEFTENRVKALWKYALTAVYNQVRRKLFSWSYVKERRDMRKEHLELLLKMEDERATSPDLARLSDLRQRSTLDDVRYAFVIRDYRQRGVPAHFGIVCDHCRGPIRGTRVSCMECGSRFTFDFCDEPACLGCTIKTRDDISSPHLPSHDFVKIRTPIVHHREIGKIMRDAKAGLERARTLLEGAETQERQREAEKSAVMYEEAEVPVRDSKEDSEPPPRKLPKINPIGSLESTESSDQDLKDEAATLACLRCESPISPPYLYCIDCPGDSKVFICSACDEKMAGFSDGKHHLATHTLVRFTKKLNESQTEDDKTGKRLDTLEHKFEGVTGQISVLTSRMDGLTSQIEGLTSQMVGLTSQIERIEKLLQLLPTASTSQSMS